MKRVEFAGRPGRVGSVWMTEPACCSGAGGRPIVILAGLVVLQLAGAFSPARGQSAREEIVSVEFTGNRAFSDAELQQAILTQPSTCPLILAVTTCALGLDWGRDRFYHSPRSLSQDVERLRILYRAHGFRGVTVDTAVVHDAGTVSIDFQIHEGPPFRVGSVNFSGDPVPPALSFEGDLPVGPGDPLSFLYLRATSDTLTNRLRGSGYASADVFLRYRLTRGSDTATVTYDVDLGPVTTVGPVRVTGNRLLDEEVILDRLPFREGQLFREYQIHEAQRSLHELGIVARALVERDTVRIDLDSVIPIRVEVEEGDAYRVRTGGGFNSAECLNFGGRWTSRNFFGGGRSLQARVQASNLLAGPLQATPLCAQAGTGEFGRVNWLVGFDFNQPTFFSRRMSLFAGVFAERRSQKNIFLRDAYGLDLGLRRGLGRNAFFSLNFRPHLSRLAAAEVTLCATFLACDPRDIAVLSGDNRLFPVTLSFSQDRTDGVFSPRNGFRILADFEFAGAGTGSDYAYVRTFADGSVYREIDASTVLALRARAGMISPGAFKDLVAPDGRPLEIVPPQKRFYGGGANSVRGFAQSTLGPRSLSIGVEELLRRRGRNGRPVCSPAAVRDLTCDGSSLAGSDLFQLRPVGGLRTLMGSAELRFDLADGLLGGVAFVDAGQVWSRRAVMSELEVTPGFGIRYNTLFGPIRFDVAYSLRDQEALRVVTSQIRPFVPGVDRESDRIDIGTKEAPGEFIDWVVSEDLALLAPVLFGDDPGFSLRRFQFHFSIGQAF